MSEQNGRSGKRRRRDAEEEDSVAKLHRKLHHALRELRKVVKKAKTFEVQKTLKKLKAARCKDPESDLTKDLSVQMAILKGLSHDQLARSALVTKLKKTKVLAADPSIQAILAELTSNLASPGIPGTQTAKVQSRILSSKVIASEVVSIVEALRTLLYPSVGSESNVVAHNLYSSLKKKRSRTGHDENGSSSEDELSEKDEGTSGDDDGWESGTISGPSDSSVARSADDLTFDRNANNSTGNLKINGSKGQSEFLPCLSVGFTLGDSGSELDDNETRSEDGIRKNRRGQRARRAIWEKKFGKNANHVKKQREQAETSRRRVRPVDRRSGRPSSRPSGLSRYDQPGDTRLGDTPLHPSWEAKRKHKAASIVASQGTKIMFSES